ncbi:ABC transporter substrate-binding protein [Patescibacteria group bacterium]
MKKRLKTKLIRKEKGSFSGKVIDYLKLLRRYFSLLPYTLKRPDKIIITILLWVILISAMGLGLRFYFNHSHFVPRVGGSYSEGIVGSPKYINPLLCQTNDADRDLCALIFAGLTRYDQNREIQGELARSWKIDKEKRSYTFTLKDNLFWQDGQPLTAEDVVFTVKLIQHPDYPGTLKTSWNNVEVEKVNKNNVRFHLKDPYSDFLSNTTLGILPKHIWEKIEPKKMLTAEYNLNPVGAGSYYFKELQSKEDEEMEIVRLKRFDQYRGEAVWLENITLKFYPTLEKLKLALSKKEIEGTFNLKGEEGRQLIQETNFSEYHFGTPQYLAVFFNQQKSDVLEDLSVRKALNYGVNRQKIIERIFLNGANLIRSPILSHLPGFKKTFAADAYSLAKAKNTLDKAGWKVDQKTKIRKKDNRELSFTLATSDQEEFVQIAEMLREDWEKIGIKIELKIYTMGTLQQEQIRPRDYQALLFGENLGPDSDLYPFWHSSQVNDPGLNLSLFGDKEADNILELARQTNSNKQKAKVYQDLFKIFQTKIPAVFLVNPTKNYLLNSKVREVETGMIATPSDRFLGINNWYVKGAREWGK